MRTYKHWEEEIAQKLLMKRLELQSLCYSTPAERENAYSSEYLLERKGHGHLNGRRKNHNKEKRSRSYGVQGNPYNQAVIAERLGVTKTCLHNWEYGKTTPNSWLMWQKWAKVLNTEFKISLSNTSNKSQEISEIIQRSFK